MKELTILAVLSFCIVLCILEFSRRYNPKRDIKPYLDLWTGIFSILFIVSICGIFLNLILDTID